MALFLCSFFRLSGFFSVVGGVVVVEEVVVGEARGMDFFDDGV